MIVGESGVGKTGILNRFVDNVFSNDVATVSGNYKEKTVEAVDGTHARIKFQIWYCAYFKFLLKIFYSKRDTAGQENFRSVTSSYYRGARGAFLVVDISSRKSFEKAECKFFFFE